jgi:hypothetical protein
VRRVGELLFNRSLLREVQARVLTAEELQRVLRREKEEF